MLFWIYSLISILMCWILYRLTGKSLHLIIFYIISLFLLLFYFMCDLFIFLYSYFKFRSDIKSLECKTRECKRCKLNDECDNLCDKTNYECVKDLFCKVKTVDEVDKCVRKDVEDCDITIKNYYDNINATNISDKKSFFDWLDDNNVRKIDFNKYIKFYLIILLFTFLCYLIVLLLSGKITIQLSFIQRDFNYIKRRMTNTM
jgi:hypothetical protein